MLKTSTLPSISNKVGTNTMNGNLQSHYNSEEPRQNKKFKLKERTVAVPVADQSRDSNFANSRRGSTEEAKSKFLNKIVGLKKE